jgi:hypothetical protein
MTSPRDARRPTDTTTSVVLADAPPATPGLPAGNVHPSQHQAGCSNDLHVDPQLQLAAQWHTDDTNRNLDADIGFDGSTAQDRALPPDFMQPPPRQSRSTQLWPSAASRS